MLAKAGLGIAFNAKPRVQEKVITWTFRRKYLQRIAVLIVLIYLSFSPECI